MHKYVCFISRVWVLLEVDGGSLCPNLYPTCAFTVAFRVDDRYRQPLS